MNKIYLNELLTESVAAAMTDFAELAIQEALVSAVTEEKYVTEADYGMIRDFAYKVVTEAADEFVPSDDEIKAMVEKLQAAGYTVVPDRDHDTKPDAGEEHGKLPENFEGSHEDAMKLQESTSLADKIAAKLQIL